MVVTVLTSHRSETLPPIWKNISINDSVVLLAQMAQKAGLTSYVCSSKEVPTLKKHINDSFLVVPGIRPEGSANQDQTRVATPRQAMASGASALVIGRPILEATDPVSAVKNILKELE